MIYIMPKKLIVLFLLIFAIALPSISSAQTSTVSTNTPTPQRFSDKNDRLRIEPTLKQAIEDRMTTLKPPRGFVKDLIAQKIEGHEQRKQTLQRKINNFKDQRRKNIILKLDDKIASISSTRVKKMNDALEKLDNILAGIKTKSDQITGCNKTQLAEAITAADEATTAASTAIEDQANKTYEININSEDSAKIDVGGVIKQLTEDLRNTHRNIIDVKQKVIKAASELRKLKSCPRISTIPTQNMSNPSVTLEPTDLINQ